MNTIKATIMIILIAATATQAQSCCGKGGSCNMNSASASNQSQYGGTVTQSGKYQIETVTNMAVKDNPVTFHVTRKGKAISSKNISGSAVINYSDGTSETDALSALNDEAVAIHSLKKAIAFTGNITMQVNGDAVNVLYDYSGVEKKGGTASYTCPMHPDVVSNTPGKCTKCGMDLQKM